jgi:hypothetical protein
VVGSAAAYGAAMFFVARRYKRRKASHKRCSSVLAGGRVAPGDMASVWRPSPALMSGGAGGLTGGGYGALGRHSPIGGGALGWGRDGMGAPERDSRGSGGTGGTQTTRSGEVHSAAEARMAGISAPVAAENSLGWN